MNYELVVIGGGPAGLAAALSAKENGIENILIIERDRELGGILQQCIHGGFGLHVFKEELTGPEYAYRFIKDLKDSGIEYKLDTMVIDISSEKVVKFVNEEDGVREVSAGAIILCMGCRERTRGAIAIPGTRPAGIFSAGTAQRYVNMEGRMVGKDIVILGSGDIGLIMARRMTLEGAKVKAVAEIMPYSGGLTRNIVQCLDDFDIPLLLSHTVIDIQGKDRVSKIILSEVDGDLLPISGTEIEYACDTLLVSVGLIPENELSGSAGIEIDKRTSGPVVTESMETSVSGIFACGNALHVHDIVDFVTEESRIAGVSAAKYILGELKYTKNIVLVKPGSGISYIVPQRIIIENVKEEITFFMRAKNVYKNAYLVVKADGTEVYKKKRAHMLPGEMEKVILPKTLFSKFDISELTIEVNEEGL